MLVIVDHRTSDLSEWDPCLQVLQRLDHEDGFVCDYDDSLDLPSMHRLLGQVSEVQGEGDLLCAKASSSAGSEGLASVREHWVIDIHVQLIADETWVPEPLGRVLVSLNRVFDAS